MFTFASMQLDSNSAVWPHQSRGEQSGARQHPGQGHRSVVRRRDRRVHEQRADGRRRRAGAAVEGCRSSAARHAVRGSAAGGLLAAPGDLLRGDVLDVGGDVPAVTERVLELAGPVAVELVLDRS
jgi:hypothetical protein